MPGTQYVCAYYCEDDEINNPNHERQQDVDIRNVIPVFDACLMFHAIPIELRQIIKTYLGKALNNETIRDAVMLWCSRRSIAILRFGLIKYWDTSSVTDMSSLFAHQYAFNDKIEQWDVSHVTDMSNMFHSTVSFNQPLNGWNVRKVKNTSGMFLDALRFNQPLDRWDVKNVRDMSHMFCATGSFNQSLNSWNMKKVKDVSYIFYEAAVFDKVANIASWRLKKKVKKEFMLDDRDAPKVPITFPQLTNVVFIDMPDEHVIDMVGNH